ncbi:hypothetical protein GGE07_000538 [Sinorhizobium terangae]|uniref:ATP-binding protein n=1 Tax=Sinorhizobium terangae TaxID=110322 RepID=A0A6N7LBD8_SINTE|nr:BREX system ATP-binding domain-containing protein [Sinorhizobium terangae]MBB4183925.1 hypothetical protein [Sinorhizobium terangae]MQX15052.1 hypothetical protein [Sinorhizobium terangae]
MNSLAELLGRVPEQSSEEDRFLSKFGFKRNPFPAARTIIEEVLYNQVGARDQFVSLVREVLVENPQRRSIGVLGGTGGGKTHFLRHCEYLMKNFRESAPRPFIVVEVLAGASSAIHLVREIYREADEAVKIKGEYDLLTAVVRSVENEAAFETVRQVELRSVLQLLFRAMQKGFVPPDRDGRMQFEPLRDLAKKWLAGAALSNTEKRYLGVFSRLGSAALMTRLLSELLTLARKQNVVDGIMLCLDEVETLFSSGVSASRIQGFLQDLRYFFDEAVRGVEGYSLLMLSASTPNGAANLRNYNYPLYQRLGFDEGSQAVLSPLSGESEARAMADVYIKHEIKRANLGVKNPPTILKDEDVEQAYATAAGRSIGTGGLIQRVNQGQLLQALHQIVEAKRAEAV